MSAAARRKKQPDSSRLKGGLSTGTELETKRASEPAKGKKKAKPAKYRKRVDVLERARSIRLTTGAIIALAGAAAIILAIIAIAEPWVRPTRDDYTAPTGYETIEPATIEVGERWSFGLELGANERITDIIVNDPDILRADEGEVLALGEYYKTSVTFSVTEATLPAQQYAHTVRLGAIDLTDEYNALRSRLRSLLGVEQPSSERTELRTLRLCEQFITVSGLDAVALTEPELSLEPGDDETIELVVTAGEGYEVYSTDEGVAYISEYGAEPGVFTIEAASVGQARIAATIGFWKRVDAETYGEYLASNPALPALAGRDGAEVAAEHPNEIYVRSGVSVYPISVA